MGTPRKPPHIPIRLCVGCGGRSPQAEMIRFGITAEGSPILKTGAATGRSAYIHPREECWELFLRRKGRIPSLRHALNREQRLQIRLSYETSDRATKGMC